VKIDTNGKGIEPGEYVFTVVAYPQAIKAGEFDKFEFLFGMDGQERPIKMSFFPNQMKGLLEALGFKATDGVFDCDITEAFGKFVKAELYSEEYTKKDGSKGVARKLRGFKSADAVPATPADIAWEE